MSAIVCLYLCESGLNSDVAVQMKPNAIRPSKRPRHIIVTGRKARAGNRAIFSELPIRQTVQGCTSAAEALLFYATRFDHSGSDTKTCPFSFTCRRTGSRP